MANLDQVVQHKILEATKLVEEQLDLELEKLESVDLKKFREERLKQLKKERQQRQEWIAKGHGEYSEVDERDFFDNAKKSQNIICHFYKTSSPLCDIVDYHFKILAPKHLEVKFCKINAEKAPFLTERLNIRIIPTILIIKDSIAIDRLKGFTELGNCEDFSTEMLEWRLARSGVIEYAGDISRPPDEQKMKSNNPWRSILRGKKKGVQGPSEGDSSDDDFLND